MTILGRNAAYLHDIYTAVEVIGVFGGKIGDAVGLVDGFAAVDNGQQPNKSRREEHFRDGTLDAAGQFALARAEASQPADLVAIRSEVGDEEALLDATVRARFGVARLGRLLRADTQGNAAELTALLEALRCSRLRKVSAYLGDGEALPDETVARLCASLPASLEELRLPGVGLAVVRPLCELVEAGHLARLCILNLSECKLGDVGSVLLVTALGSPGCGLSELDLGCASCGCALVLGCGRAHCAGWPAR